MHHPGLYIKTGMGKKALFVVVVVLGFSAAAACGGMQQPDRAIENMIRSKNIVDLDKLTASEIRLLISLIKKEAAPCPGSLSLVEELGKEKPCAMSIRALGFFYRRILDGYPETDILNQYVARFRVAKKVKIEIDGRPDTGPEDAPVIIVTFSDFQCPYCRKAALAIRRVKDIHSDKVRLVFKQFPLSTHSESMEAALAAEAALEQGRFWEMHDKLYAFKGDITPGNITSAAGKAGLDMTRWKEDMESVEVIERVNGDREEALKLKLTGTPTIFVNGVEFEEPVKYLPQYVEELIYASP